MATVIAYTSPAAGHAFPLVPGLLALRERGHEVHLRTAPELVAAIRRGGLAAESVDPRIASLRVNDHEGGDRLRRGFEGLLARADLERRDLERALAELEPDVVLVDTLAYGAGVAAERDGRPWAVTLPSLLAMPGKGIPPYGLGLPPARGPLGAVRDHIGWRVVERLYGRAMLPRLNELRTEAGLHPFRSPLEVLEAPDRVLALTGAPLEYPRTDLPGHVRLVGAQSWDPPAVNPAGCAFLREPGDPWVLVTCSTEYQGDEQLAATAIEALRDKPVRVLVTVADAHGAGALPTAPNARVERFVPHGPVLEHAAAVVCHGGMGITQKALGAGVPLVIVPFGRDQPEIGRRVVECGAGVVLPRRRLSPRRLRDALRTALTLRSPRLPAGANAGRFADACEELLPPARTSPPRARPRVAGAVRRS